MKISNFEIILIIENLILLWGFLVAFFAKRDRNVKVPGLIFGIIALCNLYYILTNLQIL